MNPGILLKTVTPSNREALGIFCIKNRKAKGYLAKGAWYDRHYEAGLRILIAEDDKGKQLGFIEFVPAEKAWRPVLAPGYLFIHCIMVYGKKERQKGVGSALIQACETRALKDGKQGICTFSSQGAWLAGAQLFEKNGYSQAGESGRFELWYKPLRKTADQPSFRDRSGELAKYQGWHLLYSDQCPWHEKSVTDLMDEARDRGIDLKVRRLDNPQEAQEAPFGYGTFGLIYNGKLLADHYISRTRFQNILKKNGL
jgi:GNAT superfamily N-acetyltransferase